MPVRMHLPDKPEPQIATPKAVSELLIMFTCRESPCGRAA